MRALVQPGIDRGSFPGAQVYASVDGQPVVDVALGEARIGTPMTRETVVSWQCSTKPLTATAVHMLSERGLVDMDDAVAKHLPEFARHGKDAVTIRHLLNHTAGFVSDPPVVAVTGPDPEQVEALVCDSRLAKGWRPGTRFHYSTWLGYATLGVVVSRLTGSPFDVFLREQILRPLGMRDSWVGVPPEDAPAVSERMAFLYDTAGAEPTVPPIGGLAGAQSLESCSPGMGGIGPIRELGWFYEALLRVESGGAARPVSASTLAAMREAATMETGKGHYGLGLLVSPMYFGEWCPRAFGHDGMRCSMAFADPDSGIVVAIMVNGMGRKQENVERFLAVGREIYQSVASWTRRSSARNPSESTSGATASTTD